MCPRAPDREWIQIANPRARQSKYLSVLCATVHVMLHVYSCIHVLFSMSQSTQLHIMLYHTLTPTPAVTFSVMSYNVLCHQTAIWLLPLLGPLLGLPQGHHHEGTARSHSRHHCSTGLSLSLSVYLYICMHC